MAKITITFPEKLPFTTKTIEFDPPSWVYSEDNLHDVAIDILYESLEQDFGLRYDIDDDGYFDEIEEDEEDDTEE